MMKTRTKAAGEAYLSIRSVRKTFGSLVALDDVNLDIRNGEFVCILGPSGCGKTTLLRVIAGLEQQDRGLIFLSGEDISRTSPAARNFGIVFQSYALFPNLTADHNIAYGLKGKGYSRQRVADRVREMLSLVGLEAFRDKFPGQLSGGQQQRVALARALAFSPRLLLLDEPLSALDARVREKLRHEVRNLQERLKLTTVMVTHDQEEALTMADRVVVMEDGRIVQCGSPEEVYSRPTDASVADFVGSMNFLKDVPGSPPHGFMLGEFCLKTVTNGVPAGARATLAIRPEHIQVLADDARQDNVLMATIKDLEFRGSFYRLHLVVRTDAATNASLQADVLTEHVGRLGLAREKRVPVQLPENRIIVFAHAPS